jgi:hypothetical protein
VTSPDSERKLGGVHQPELHRLDVHEDAGRKPAGDLVVGLVTEAIDVHDDNDDNEFDDFEIRDIVCFFKQDDD